MKWNQTTQVCAFLVLSMSAVQTMYYESRLSPYRATEGLASIILYGALRKTPFNEPFIFREYTPLTLLCQDKEYKNNKNVISL